MNADPTLNDRRSRLAAAARAAGVDAVLVSPGADLQYLTGVSVGSHERLSCLVVLAKGDAFLLVPTLERPGWTALDEVLPISTWSDGADPHTLLAGRLGAARVVAVDEDMPVGHAWRLRDALPGHNLRLAGDVLAGLRMCKSPDEITELEAVGAAIDRVHRDIPRWLHPGRTEHEVAADITAAMVADGHARADFVIVGSGPNGASPHHEASDRIVQPGDLVVVDIGGPNHAGYYSDCTRTYQVAGPADPEAAQVYEIVRQAQQAGVDAVRPGATAAAIDAAARGVIADAGYGEFFITRTGHGIGLQVHEHPYLVAGNDLELRPGMAFSVEPGIYLPGRFGVRIEDIVVVGDEGPILVNNASRQLTQVGG